MTAARTHVLLLLVRKSRCRLRHNVNRGGLKAKATPPTTHDQSVLTIKQDVNYFAHTG